MLLVYTTLAVSLTAVGLDIYRTYKNTKNFKGLKQPEESEVLFYQIAQKLDNIKHTRLKYRWLKYKYKRNKYLLDYNYIQSVESLDAFLHKQIIKIHNEIQNYDSQIMTRKLARHYRKEIKKLLKGVEYSFKC